MAERGRYDLGLNAAVGARTEAFVTEVARAAKQRRIRWFSVANGQSERIARGVDRRQIEVSLFLNTQADGVNMESPVMLLCRSLKAAGSLVVEDPDDAPVYANRATQMRYLERAGIAVPRYVVINGRPRERAALPVSQRKRLGPSWTARPALGMSQSRTLTSRSLKIGAALSRAGFTSGQKVLLCRHHEPATLGEHELRFRVWYLFGQIVPCWWPRGGRHPHWMTADDWEPGRLTDVTNCVARIARITGLDWFMTELLVTRSRSEPELLVTEPANALAGLGPGAKPLAEVPADVLRLAADRIVEIAWRRAHKLPLTTGTSAHLAPSARR